MAKLIITEKEIASLVLDPHLETADIDLANNHWPRKTAQSRIKLRTRPKRTNPMQAAAKEAERAAKHAAGEDMSNEDE